MMAKAFKFSHLRAPESPRRRFLELPNSRLVSVRHASVKCCAMSMNGCQADPSLPVGIVETRTLPKVSDPWLAIKELGLAISALKLDPPGFSSGIIRLEVPIQQNIEAISWLHAQCQQPRCFFSGRNPSSDSSLMLNGNSRQYQNRRILKLINVAGVGSAVYFQQFSPFSLNDWKCIKRFLSKKCPLIRAYGALRFDARTTTSSEWESFGSFYFAIPQVELDEVDGGCILAGTVAWDSMLLCSFGNAIRSLEETIHQISFTHAKLEKELQRTTIISKVHIPPKASWDKAVVKALDKIHERSSNLVKVVLARSSRVVTGTDIDPIELLACIQVEGQNAYQFCIQPQAAPAFIGNTPEQLFHRRHLYISSEALAGTRPRGISEIQDLQIEKELFSSPKDHLEFTIVRKSIRRKLEVSIEPKKAIRKLPRIQHLYAQLSGRLRSEDDEFEILSTVHPSPAVCGLPTEEARTFIAETEMFDRGLYAGPVGWFGGTESEFAVGIRSALVIKGLGILIYAGTGIVEGADPSSEWEELELKASQFTQLIEHGIPLSCCHRKETQWK